MTTEELIPAGLKRFRKKFNLSQKETATLLGITEKAYQNYEYGKGSPTAAAILKLSKKFDVTTDYLLGQSDEPRPPKLDAKIIALVQMMQETFQPRQTVTA